MAFDQSQLVENDLHCQLSERRGALVQCIQALEGKLQAVRDLGRQWIDKRSEYQDLAQQLGRLASQEDTFFNISSRLGDATLYANDTGPHLQDFKKLDINREGRTEYLSNDKQALDKIIVKLQDEINSNKIELELVEKQMKGQAEDNKRKDAVARGYVNTELPEKNGEQVIHVNPGADDVTRMTSDPKIQEIQNIVELQDRRIQELLENEERLKAQLKLLMKQKDELLQVNHQWDDQYRQLKADRERLGAELQKSYETRETGEVQRLEPNVGNEETSKFIQDITQQNEKLCKKIGTLQDELVGLKEHRQKQDKLWVAAKKMISEEREARESATQRRQASEERCKHLENQLEIGRQTEVVLKQEIERLVGAGVGGYENTANRSQVVLGKDQTEEIEMLKQQIQVYVDDFANERADRERIQADREAMKEKIKEFEKEIYLLKEQVRIYRQDFDKERRDKEILQRQLRGDNLQVEEPWYLAPPNDYVSMHPVQRRQQPMYHDRGYRYTPREIQELAFQQQQQQHQPLHPRGQTSVGHPGGLCHGCEADGNVVDGGSAILRCPRCERVFASNERRAFEDHIDKCTT